MGQKGQVLTIFAFLILGIVGLFSAISFLRVFTTILRFAFPIMLFIGYIFLVRSRTINKKQAAPIFLVLIAFTAIYSFTALPSASFVSGEDVADYNGVAQISVSSFNDPNAFRLSPATLTDTLAGFLGGDELLVAPGTARAFDLEITANRGLPIPIENGKIYIMSDVCSDFLTGGEVPLSVGDRELFLSLKNSFCGVRPGQKISATAQALEDVQNVADKVTANAKVGVVKDKPSTGIFDRNLGNSIEYDIEDFTSAAYLFDEDSCRTIVAPEERFKCDDVADSIKIEDAGFLYALEDAEFNDLPHTLDVLLLSAGNIQLFSWNFGDRTVLAKQSYEFYVRTGTATINLTILGFGLLLAIVAFRRQIGSTIASVVPF